MKIYELITYLRSFPQDAEVVVLDLEFDDTHSLSPECIKYTEDTNTIEFS